MPETPATASSSGRNATIVAAGILLSRLFGLARQKLFAHYLGNSVAAAAFSAATRIPNVLQNLLGEGVLSASFIPVYAGLRAQGKDDEARRVAGAVFGLLALLVGLLVALGLFAAPLMVDAIAPGYQGEARALTIRLVRIIFPGTGVLVLSAWCLGILNSHKRFFLSYSAPVLWNVAIVGALVLARSESQDTLAAWAAWGTVAGSGLQFLVQWPNVRRLLGAFSVRPSLQDAGVRQVVSGFLPAVAARGVVQVSAWVDLAYASLLTERAVAALTYSQAIALLPVSLFGMAISAAELPAMSEDAVKSEAERTQALTQRLDAGLTRLSFFVIPSAVAFLLLGDFIAGLLLESGKFTPADSRLAWYILIGSGVALLAQTSGRLYSSAFYALKDTRTPLRFAAVRVTLGVAFGYFAVRILPGLLGLPGELGVVFITVTTGLTAWLEMALLRRKLATVLGPLPSPWRRQALLWAIAVASGALALGLKLGLVSAFGARPGVAQEWGGAVLPAPGGSPVLWGLVVLSAYSACYGLGCLVFGVPEARALMRRVLRRKA